MRKRERENPCVICGHYHRYEEGEVCGVCGHRISVPWEVVTPPISAFPSEIINRFLYLGSYDHASRAELLKTQGISHILNTVPLCPNLFKNTFSYHSLEDGDDKTLPLDDAILFLEQCERERARVLVHCMSGRSRSPTIVIAYLMKCRGWKLTQSCQWVKERRPVVDLSHAFFRQLVDFEKKIYGAEADGGLASLVPTHSFGFGYSTLSSSTIPDATPSNGFSFGASRTPVNESSPEPESHPSPDASLNISPS